MERGISGLVIASVMSVLVLAWQAPTVRAAEPDRKEQVSNRRARELIDDLGNRGVRIVYPEHYGEPYLVIPKTFNWHAHQRVRETIQELIKMGVAAFPDLAAHESDDRFCCFNVNEVDRPLRVGEVCDAIIKCQLVVFPYGGNSKMQGVWGEHLLRRFLSSSKTASWAEWWKKNRDGSLLETQIAVAESSLAILKDQQRPGPEDSGGSRRSEDDPQFNAWRARQLKPIEQTIQELKKEKTPKRGELHLSIQLVDRSGVTKTGDEARYGFYNGK
jgi:hypothetical protein